MGLLFTPKLSWTCAKIKLASQAQKVILNIQNSEHIYGYLLHKESFKLFDAMVKSILCYASQIWGYEYCEIIESVQINFCRRILELNKTTVWSLVNVGDYL